jgi:glycosyltransferase involved in cell wall biosynthesis
MRFSPRKFDGYRRRLVYEWDMWRGRQDESRRQRRFDHWIDSLRASPPDVFLGPDLPYGGVRGHVRAIAKYSGLKVQLVPDERALGGLDQFTMAQLERFLEFDPPGTPVVHSHVVPWFIRWCQRQQKRGSLWVHTYHLPYFPEHAKDGILQPDQIEINDCLIHEARHADLRISVSRWQQEWLLREHGIESIYLPNGVDIEACDNGNAKRFRAKHRINGPFILWVGRNDPVKNPRDFVRLAQAMPEMLFVMIGGGLSKVILREEWQVDAPSNLVIPGALSHLEVQDAISACSVLVVTSKREGLPTLVLEGMVRQKPVVVPDEAGCVEAIGNGDFGTIYRQGQIDELAVKVEGIASDSAIGTLARKRVLEKYDWRAIAPKLDSIYRRLS